MAKREWFPKQRDWTQKYRNLIVYTLTLVGAVGSLVALTLLPDMVSINPDSANTVARPKELMAGLHFGLIALFTGLFWRRPRELVYLGGAVFMEIMLMFMLYTNLGM